MPDTFTTDHRQALAAAAEQLIERNGWQAATAWAYGLPPQPGPDRLPCVLVCTATGDVQMDIGTGGTAISWHTGDQGAAATVDEQLICVQQAGWTHLFTLNACACEGDGRVPLPWDECHALRHHSAAEIQALGILSDEGILYRRCTCGAEEASRDA